VLSDRERETLCEIERRLRDEDPKLARTFDHAGRDGRLTGRTAVVVVAGVLGVCLLALGQPAGALAFALVAGWAWGTTAPRIRR
jgi:hypothetical protein